MKTIRKLASHLSVWFIASAFSMTIRAQQDFPQALQSRFDTSEFELVEDGLLGLGIADLSPYVGSYFVYLDENLNERVLIRYSIGGGSQVEDFFQSTPLTGIAYLDCQQSLSLDQLEFKFDLYLEKLDQDVTATGIHFPHATIDLRYTEVAALLAGSGSYESMLAGDLISTTPPVGCLADGCSIGATFQLSRVGYVDLGNGNAELNIDPVAAGMNRFPRLYEHYSQFVGDEKCPGFDFFQRFELSPINVGDVNRDGTVDLLDIAPFVNILNSGRYQFESDANKDHRVDLLDVSAFIAILTGP